MFSNRSIRSITRWITMVGMTTVALTTFSLPAHAARATTGVIKRPAEVKELFCGDPHAHIGNFAQLADGTLQLSTAWLSFGNYFPDYSARFTSDLRVLDRPEPTISTTQLPAGHVRFDKSRQIVDADGSYTFAGPTFATPPPMFASAAGMIVGRGTPAGALDTGFNGSGFTFVNLPSGTTPREISSLHRFSTTGGAHRTLVVLNAPDDTWFTVISDSGLADQSFGTNGWTSAKSVLAALSTTNRSWLTRAHLSYGAVVDRVGRILVGVNEGSPLTHGGVIRLRPDGAVDDAFGDRGLAEVPNSMLGDEGSSNIDVRVDQQQRIVVVRFDSRAVRFNADGRIDPSPNIGYVPSGSEVALDDGSVLQRSESGSNIRRFNPDGSLDLRFNGRGDVTSRELGLLTLLGAAVAPSGDLLVAGFTEAAGTGCLQIRRFHLSSGYWMLGAGGKVYSFGDAVSYGDVPAAQLPKGTTTVDLELTPDRSGYWILSNGGRIFSFGGAEKLSDNVTLRAGEQATSLSTTPDGKGLWVFTNIGRVITLGNAKTFGDMSSTRLNGPVLDSIVTPTGNGYYMVASDGGVFTFGDARFFGSMGGTRLNKPVQALVPTATGNGYWLVASDGGIFAFGDAPFKGSMGNVRLNKPVRGMVRHGDGYLMVGEDGGIFTFSSSPFHGSLGNTPPSIPIVSAAAY